MSRPIRVHLLHVRDCALIDDLRRVVDDSVARLGVDAVVDQIEGPFPSPTLLVDGVDVAGGTDGWAASCRLDVPTEAQIVEAIIRARISSAGGDAASERT